MKKGILIMILSAGYANISFASERAEIKFNFPALEIKGLDKPVPVEFTISASTLLGIGGLIGLAQTASLIKDGIQKISDPNDVKQAEGKRILAYSGLLLCGSVLAILGKIVFK